MTTRQRLFNGILVSGGYAKSISCWKVAEDGVTKNSEVIEEIVCSFVQVGNNSFIIGCGEGAIFRYEINPTTTKFTLSGQLNGHRDYVFALDYCSQKNMLATGATDNVVMLWNLGNNQQTIKNDTISFSDHTSSVYSVKFLNAATNQIVSSNNDGGILLHDFEKKKLVRTYDRHHEDYIFNIDVDESKNVLYSCSADKSIKVTDFRIATKPVIHVSHEKSSLFSILCDKNDYFVGDYSQGNVMCFDLRTNKKKNSWKAHGDTVRMIVGCTSQDCIFTCSDDHYVKIWKRMDNRWTKVNVGMKMKEKHYVLGMECLANFVVSKNLRMHLEDLDNRIQFLSSVNKVQSGGEMMNLKYLKICIVGTDAFFIIKILLIKLF